MDEQPPVRRSLPQLILGLVIVTVGLLLTLDRLGIIEEAEYYLRFWPAGLIAIGFGKLWQCRSSHSGVLGGVVIAGAGVWLLLDEFDLVRRSFWDLWPLVLVALGASLVWRAFVGRRPAPHDSTSVVSAVAVMSGVSRGNNSAAFRGGDLTAIMGGCEIDLRQAQINGEAVIDVFALWGGIDIRVPENWTVVGQVTPLMGGYEDKTRPPHPENPSPTALPGLRPGGEHRLIIRGFILMAGVEVKN